ncbi:MAG: hypothetical protein HQK65_13180, partial [Desulfamplus sp.]|nr:hypothetical protein [Desulfamplus sp.]
VILDEPNSNLDTEGEAALVNALHQLKKDKITTIMITHNTELLQHVDKILVLEKGKTAFFGTEKQFSTQKKDSKKTA